MRDLPRPTVTTVVVITVREARTELPVGLAQGPRFCFHAAVLTPEEEIPTLSRLPEIPEPISASGPDGEAARAPEAPTAATVPLAATMAKSANSRLIEFGIIADYYTDQGPKLRSSVSCSRVVLPIVGSRLPRRADFGMLRFRFDCSAVLLSDRKQQSTIKVSCLRLAAHKEDAQVPATLTAPKLNTSGRSRILAAIIGSLAALAVAAAVIATPANAASGAYTNGAVNAIAYDNSGGFYIGGSFTTVKGTSRSYIAHINADSSLDTNFTPTLNGTVQALAFSGTKLYVGGTFTTANSTTRNNAAAFNTDGTLDTSWDPNTNGTVTDFALSGSDVYMSGSFTTLGSSNTRNRLAVVTTGGSLGSWAPSVNGTVDELVVSGSNVYFGGSFSSVTATTTGTRNNGAAVSTAGALTTWDPNTNGPIKAMATDDTNVYFGGSFTSVNSNTRNNAAAKAVGASTAVTTWDPNVSPNASASINSIAITGNNVFLGGYLTGVRGAAGSAATRFNFAGITKPSGSGAALRGTNLNLNGNGNPQITGSGCANNCA
ncbi:MAG: delta-60 repeat domain-containing protein, partial [Ilumatobacteraceae bacterium]